MKVLLLVAAMVISSASFADKHMTKNGQGHNKEHQHTSEGVDHPHEEAHHNESAEEHKAHHPEHGTETKSMKKPMNNNKKR